jgi:uncharacterized membrane protein SpoIIM required for sporulation
MALPVGSPGEIARRWMGGYLAAAVAVFAAGAGLGWLLIGGVSLSALAAFGTEASLFPSRITVRTILVNNLLALAVVLSGVVTFAVTTVVSLLFNGLLIGFFLGAAAPASLPETLALILPHGLLELPAFWIAGGVALRVTHRLIRYLRGNADDVLSRSERYEAVLLAALAIGLIVVAAVIEARFTIEIAEWLTGRQFESL